MSGGAADLAIVGGGAAGLMAAAAAESLHVKCVVLERKARIGSKMLMTANGRCNFTKAIPAARFLDDVGDETAAFVREAVFATPPDAIAAGFRARGLAVKRMTDARLFPASEKAADVVHVFGDLLRDAEIPLATNCPVSRIERLPGGGFAVATRNFTIEARNVLIATGGMSFPKTGSVGDGYNFARSLGHKIVPCRAGLTGFEARIPFPRGAAPHGPRQGRCTLLVEGLKVVCSYSGEVEFEPWGVSGAAVYNCQRVAARRNLKDFTIRIEAQGLGGPIELRSPRARPPKESIVTIGGVSLDEVDPRTMASRIVPGLYFAGEVLDIDGPTGGYNLSLAFATARLAVRSIAATLSRTSSTPRRTA